MPYTPTTWVEGVTTLGPTNMNKIETELAYLDARIPPVALGYGTTLPGSPVDGQEYVLVDSTTNPSYQWRFRYNAGSSSAYKWEFVGGAEAYAVVDTTETCSSTTAVDLATLGPQITLPRAGDYIVRGSAIVGQGTAGTTYNASIVFTPNNTLIAGSMVNGGGQGWTSNVSGFVLVTGYAAATVVKMQYLTAQNNVTFQNRHLSVTPRRVS